MATFVGSKRKEEKGKGREKDGDFRWIEEKRREREGKKMATFVGSKRKEEKGTAAYSTESLPLLFKYFSPTDERLIDHYLRLKNEGRGSEVQIIGEVDFYKYEPWELPGLSVLKSDHREWFFFCRRDAKGPVPSRKNRLTAAGFWKRTGRVRSIRSSSSSCLIGTKRKFFYNGRGPNGTRTDRDWIMHEYRLYSATNKGILLQHQVPVGDKSRIRCWHDMWVQDMTLKEAFLDQGGVSWRPKLLPPLPRLNLPEKRLSQAKSQNERIPTGLFLKKPSDDGYNWRKYGPLSVSCGSRCYYRCAFSGCCATKMCSFDHSWRGTEVLYKGKHNHDIPFQDAFILCRLFQKERFDVIKEDQMYHPGSSPITTSTKSSYADPSDAIDGGVLKWGEFLPERFAEEGIEKQMTSESQGMVFDVETVEMKSSCEKIGVEFEASGRDKKFEIEDIGIEWLETSDIDRNTFSIIQGEGSEKQITLELEKVVFDNEAFEMTLSFSSFDALQTLNLSRTRISFLPKSIVRLVGLKRLILSYCTHLRELPPEVGELKQLEVLDLERTGIMDLPPSFFNYMHALQILNLSSTNICSLPKSIARLVSLKRLILRYCYHFMELPLEVLELEQLEVLDIEGTWIKDLPENLRCPMLLELYLHNNPKLRTIPPSFFDYMPALQTLNLSKTRIKSLPESFVKLVSLKRLIFSYWLLSEVRELKQLEVLDLEGTKIMDLHERVIDLEGKEITHLLENPSQPKSLAVFLHNNHKLKTIVPSFFDYVPAVQVLNLSNTSIKSLPESIFRLVSLKMLILSNCHRFLRLSPKVGELKQLEVLDLEGTEIIDLPTEIKELTNLTCLNLSFYGYMGDGSSVMESDAVVPRGAISALYSLEELTISVNPDDKRWNACVQAIVTELCTLVKLNTLLFYFPRVELVSHYLLNRRSWVSPLSHFRFIVGHHVKSIMSRCPRGVELELERWERCLEYINGDKAIPEEIKTVLQYSTAFFLERHATIKKLSDFGIENMKQLKCCVVGECNEVEVIIDETDAHEEDSALEEDDEAYAFEEDNIAYAFHEDYEYAKYAVEEDSEEDAQEEDDEVVLGSLEYLCIYYMKNLRRIWEGPVQPKSLSLLKFLTLRTCPKLTTPFTTGLLDNLCNLEELTIDDCPSIQTLVSCEVSAEHKTSYFLPNLKRISLHYMPGLVSISSGLHIAPRLKWLSFYNCPNLKNLLIEEVSSKDLKKIEGERSWWEALEWSTDHPAYLDDIFVPINIEDY